MRKIFDFHGGIHPPENKHQSTQGGIESIALPKELIIPLNQHVGAAADPVVETGQHVLKGQLIAEAHGFVSANIHAPTSGHIRAIELRTANHASGMAVLSIVLEPDGEDRWIELESCDQPETLDAQAIIAKVRAAGLAGMGGAGFPTSVKLGGKDIQTLILNAAECEPYITADDILLRHYAAEVLAGAQLLARVFPRLESILIGIEDNKPEAIASLEHALAAQPNTGNTLAIEIVVVPTKYPSGGEKQLIQLLTGKEVPSGKIPAAIGIVMQNVATARAAWRAVRYGEPLISRITTVVGKALKKQGNIEVLIGTPIAHVLSERGFRETESERVVVGGPMMGWAIEDTLAPVVKATNCLLLPSKEELPAAPPEQACIRCGLCAEACPAELLPQQLYWYARAEDQEKLRAYNIFDCIECGACSYVCPSSIPLVQYYRAAKGTIRQAEKDKRKSDQARLRFEARQERIAKAEAEKEAKRLERKKAAEEAKRKLAEKQAAEKSASAYSATESAKDSTKDSAKKDAGEPDMKAIKSEMVKEALAAAAAKKSAQQDDSSEAEKELKRLQRGLSSAESRLERARATLLKNQEEGADATRLDTLAARVKEAEQKVNDARKKLEAAQ